MIIKIVILAILSLWLNVTANRGQNLTTVGLKRRLNNLYGDWRIENLPADPNVVLDILVLIERRKLSTTEAGGYHRYMGEILRHLSQNHRQHRFAISYYDDKPVRGRGLGNYTDWEKDESYDTAGFAKCYEPLLKFASFKDDPDAGIKFEEVGFNFKIKCRETGDAFGDGFEALIHAIRDREVGWREDSRKLILTIPLGGWHYAEDKLRNAQQGANAFPHLAEENCDDPYSGIGNVLMGFSYMGRPGGAYTDLIKYQKRICSCESEQESPSAQEWLQKYWDASFTQVFKPFNLAYMLENPDDHCATHEYISTVEAAKLISQFTDEKWTFGFVFVENSDNRYGEFPTGITDIFWPDIFPHLAELPFQFYTGYDAATTLVNVDKIIKLATLEM